MFVQTEKNEEKSTLNRCRPVELKKNYGGGLPAFGKCRPM